MSSQQENNSHATAHELPTQKMEKQVAFGAVVAAGALALSFFQWGTSLYDDLRTRINDVASDMVHVAKHDLLRDRVTDVTARVVAIEKYNGWHSEEANRWKDEIVQNRKAISILQQEIAKLRADPQSRPDPFTGSDAKNMRRELQKQIDELRGTR